MLDAGLTCGGSFKGGDAVGNVAEEADVFLFGFVSDGEVGSAIEDRLDFDEVNAFGDELIDGFAGFVGGFDDDRRLEAGRVAIEIGASEKDLRAEKLAVGNFFAELLEEIDGAVHVAHGGDAVGDEQRDDEVAAPRGFAGGSQVDVRVDEAGDEKFAGGVDGGRVGGKRDAARRTNQRDVIALDENRGVELRRGTGGIDDRGVGDGQGGNSSGSRLGRAGHEK